MTDYRVLVVDDERIIREGIAGSIDWKAHRFSLVGTAVHGQDALEKIRDTDPDIVITDVKMPVLDGLELIRAVRQESPRIRFIILSGFSEFEYAQTAMAYGVTYYLTKPTDQAEIVSALEAVAREMEQAEEKEAFLRDLRQDMQKAMPLVKEQFLRDCVVIRRYTPNDMATYKRLIGIDEGLVRLIVAQSSAEVPLEELFTLKRVAEREGGRVVLLLNTVFLRSLIVLIRDAPVAAVLEYVDRVRLSYREYFGTQFSFAVSSAGDFSDVNGLYKETLEYLSHTFYLGAGSVVSSEDVRAEAVGSPDTTPDYDPDRMIALVKAGDSSGVRNEVAALMDTLRKGRVPRDVAVSFSMELLLRIVRWTAEEEIDRFLGQIIDLRELGTIEAIQGRMEKVLLGITEKRLAGLSRSRDYLVQLLVQKIDRNLHNSDLSLKWLSENVVHANVDYLSKVFRKRVGERYSSYVLRKRMERAKAILDSGTGETISEIAQKVGMGANPQYFSYVFRKYTGVPPTEYRKG